MMIQRQVACTLRRTSLTSWVIVNDADHESIGVASVEIISHKLLRLHYDFTADKVCTVAVTLDEAFASYPIFIRTGASVGCTYMDIYLYEGPSMTPIDPGLYSMANANLWVWGLFMEEES